MKSVDFKSTGKEFHMVDPLNTKLFCPNVVLMFGISMLPEVAPRVLYLKCVVRFSFIYSGF